ncbi:protein kinase [Pantoea sp. paga]|uniref:protein kinase domain-containing protein n=1 Tax=Pantoea sp. paga TaxID=2597519 RepID=UPI00117F69D6|nr:protein kinase [Pantoea sp. paga]TSH78684.1 protein kinase [Pantoea sp. paga]
MNSTYYFLKKLDLLSINGHAFVKGLNNGSALSAIYSNGEEKIVIKFLINPRNKVELERFKLEYSVLKCNYINSFWTHNGYVHKSELWDYENDDDNITDPLPKIKVPIFHSHDNHINYFGYKYEEGVLLSDYDTTHLSLDEKLLLITRIASALNYFNMCGYIHRDLHPGNILLMDNPRMFDDLVQPRVMILDLGNCQRNTEHHYEKLPYRLDRDLDEEAVFNDNNKRLLSSFTSMPPDFLTHGENTRNYDAWAIGIYSYELIFGVKPFLINSIKDVYNIKELPFIKTDVMNNLLTLKPGIRLVFQSLLNSDGNKRPGTDAIVRLFNCILDDDDFCDNKNGYAQRIIRDDGFDLEARHDY